MLRRRLILMIAGLWAALALGCASGPARPVTIDVRDAATREPVADAIVRLRPIHLFVPLGEHTPVLDPWAAEGVTGVTDADGRVVLRVASERPLELVIFAPGFLPFELPLELGLLSNWRSSVDTAADLEGERLEARVED